MLIEPTGSNWPKFWLKKNDSVPAVYSTNAYNYLKQGLTFPARCMLYSTKVQFHEMLDRPESKETWRGIRAQNKLANTKTWFNKTIFFQVDFFWINRDQKSFEWFVKLLSQLEIEQAEQGGAMSRFSLLQFYQFVCKNLIVYHHSQPALQGEKMFLFHQSSAQKSNVWILLCTLQKYKNTMGGRKKV